MQAIYFTLAGIALYFISDWIVQRIEIARGERLEHRTLLFFVIITTLALASFSLIQRFTG